MSKPRRRPRPYSTYPAPPLGPGQFCQACAYQFTRSKLTHRGASFPGRCPNCGSRVWWVPPYLWRGGAKSKPQGGRRALNPALIRQQEQSQHQSVSTNRKLSQLFDLDDQ